MSEVPFRSRPLVGRRRECAELDSVAIDAAAGQSRVVVLRGEAGVGKTALLDYLSHRVTGWRVAAAVGVESEMELGYSGLHQLCAPMLDHLDLLPPPQHDALATVFGLSPGPVPDAFLVGLAALTLLSEVAEERPLLCLVDDAQWLDQASARTLGFVARRLFAEPIALVFATRRPGDELRGLQQLEVRGLDWADARTLLSSAAPFLLDAEVRDLVVAETGGNPLALLELPRGLTATELAGGLGLLGSHALEGRIEESFLRRLEALPHETRRLLLVAAAEPTGDALLAWRAAERLGIAPSAVEAAEAEELITFGERVTFRHPLVRSGVYRSGSPAERRAVHLALAEVTDPDLDPDRRAWHLAAATPKPDEDVALELERSAGRARARGGLAAAAALLQRSVTLTGDPALRPGRALGAARAYLHAGAFDSALGMLAAAEASGLDEFQRANADLLRGQIALVSSAGREAPRLLLTAARRFEPLDVSLARETYLDAWGAAMFAGQFAHGDLLYVSRAAEVAPKPAHGATPSDLLLEGLATLVTRGRAAAAPTLRRAVDRFRDGDVPVEKGLQWAVLASTASVILWDFDSWQAILTRQADRARDAGAFAPLSIALHGKGIVVTWCGNFAAAATPITEAAAITEATGTRIAPYGSILLAAFRGREEEASTLIRTTIEEATAGGEGLGVQFARWAGAVLSNGLGRYDDALAAAREASTDTPELFVAVWALPELIEAAVKSGDVHTASDALARLTEAGSASDSEWGLGIAVRSQALLSEGPQADSLYRQAVARLSRTRLRPELARAHLLYGEWLRHEGRRLEAREQLGVAHDMLTAIGMEAFAERARRELVATGAMVRRPTVDTSDQLTTQEEHIARLASEGLTNPEIGARLYISARTVEWHLGKVFTKLGIRSRRDLWVALGDDGAPMESA